METLKTILITLAIAAAIYTAGFYHGNIFQKEIVAETIDHFDGLYVSNKLYTCTKEKY